MIKIEGACHCGLNTFSIDAQPEFQFICYCKNCRVLNGSHLCGVLCDDANFVKSNSTQSYAYKGGSGEAIIMHFCPTCATQLYAYPTAHKGKVVLRANTLGEYDFNSQQNLFPESAFTWDPV